MPISPSFRALSGCAPARRPAEARVLSTVYVGSRRIRITNIARAGQRPEFAISWPKLAGALPFVSESALGAKWDDARHGLVGTERGQPTSRSARRPQNRRWRSA